MIRCKCVVFDVLAIVPAKLIRKNHLSCSLFESQRFNVCAICKHKLKFQIESDLLTKKPSLVIKSLQLLVLQVIQLL